LISARGILAHARSRGEITSVEDEADTIIKDTIAAQVHGVENCVISF